MTTVSAPAILLLGEPGRGKTFSIGTLARRKKVFYLFTDPGGDESLLDSLEYYKVPVDNVHWHYVAPTSSGWDTLEELTQKVQALNYETLASLKSGINKSDHRQMFKIIEVLSNFKCQRTGQEFGDATTWGPECAFVFDSLTGLNKIAKDTTVGAKPTLHQGEWGVAMQMEENFIRKVVSDIRCTRVLIGHLDKQVNELAQRIEYSVSLLGNKLAPQIPHLFSDVILAKQEGGKFQWATFDDRIALKTRNLELSPRLAPDFGPILDRWESRLQRAGQTEPLKD